MRKVQLSDIKRLIMKIRPDTSFNKGITLNELILAVKELSEMFESLYVRFEDLEKLQKANKELEADLKKLRSEIDRAKVDLINTQRSVNAKPRKN
jgi:hypothetical protein